MSPITQLPCEIVAIILANLNHLRDLPPTLLVCRHFYTSFKESYGIEASIFRRQITPALVPYAVAVMEASRLPRPLSHRSIYGLLEDLYNQPACLAARLPTLPPTLIYKMSRTHEAIHALAIDFATSALDLIPLRDATSTGASAGITLSSLEYFRFCRAFYRVDLFYTLFRDRPFGYDVSSWFFSRQPAWENEQLGCVYEYLEARLARASRDVLAHDVFFGELAVDYLMLREDSNHCSQSWLSRGVEFVYNLTIAGSYDAKHTMLQSTFAFSNRQVDLLEALHEVLSDAADDRNVKEMFGEEALLSTEISDDEQTQDDPDRGPYEAWCNLQGDWIREASLMFDDDAWLRERAFLFWDRDRLQKQFEDGFGKEPEDRPGPTKQEHEEMIESFDERSKIWQKGGTGYWARGDTSRIVWPEQ